MSEFVGCNPWENIGARNARVYRYQEFFVIFCVILSPIFSNYKFSNYLSYGDLLIFSVLPWFVLRFYMSYLNFINLFAILLLVAISFFLLGLTDVYNGFYRASFYCVAVILLMCSERFNLPSFFFYYGCMSYIASLALLGQWVIYVALGVAVPLQLPVEFFEPDTLNVIDHVFRSGGLFREPSYFALFVMPFMIYAAYEKKLLAFIVVAAAGVVSTSSLSFFIIMICFFIILRGCLPLSVALFSLFFAVLIVSVGLFVYSGEYIFLDRVRSIFVDGGTLNDRFLPIRDLLSVSLFFFPSVEGLTYYRSAEVWFSSAVSFVVYFGWGGLLLFILGLYRLGYFGGAIFVALIFTTHFMSGVYGYFVAFCLLMVKHHVLSLNSSADLNRCNVSAKSVSASA